MKTATRKTVKFILVSAFVVPAALFAAENAVDDHAGHHPVEARPAERAGAVAQNSFDQLQERMQVRMRAMQQLSDPQARSALMTAQMQDMQETLKGVGCPMAGTRGANGMGMMGNVPGHMGTGAGQMGNGTTVN